MFARHRSAVGPSSSFQAETGGRPGRSRRSRLGPWLWLLGLVTAGTGTAIGAAVVGRASNVTTPYVVFGYNELGMHCMNADYSEMLILPPYNTLRAQVLRRGGEPRIMTSGVTVRYTIPSNTHSADKTNFWKYAPALLGANLAPDIGLAGFGLSGTMALQTGGDWGATGIPLVPIDDNGRENAYPLASISVERNGVEVARTQAVVPVSTEMSCNLCHNTGGMSTAMDILRKHDRLHGTDLKSQRPVLCASCHSDNALGLPGQSGVKSLSAAMHGAHSVRMGFTSIENKCYACHPGVRTNCQRDVHAARGISCEQCHGTMADVGAETRRPWIDLPTCGSCHQARRPNFQFEQAGKLFKESVGHGGVHCAACHAPQHTTGPAMTATDNQQANLLMGRTGVINDCTVCHTSTPSEAFFHSVGD